MAARHSREAYRVFISHSHKDRWIARHMAKEMEGLGKKSIDIFLDEKSIEVGRPIAKEVREAIERCDEFVVPRTTIEATAEGSEMSSATSRVRGPRQIKVFLSYAYVDVVNARRIRNLLIHHLGLQVFLHEDLSAGENWRPKLRKELEHTDVFVALLTPTSVTDSWLLQETGAAWALEKPIVPIVTRRDVLNNFPLALDPHAMIEVDYLNRLEDPENADKFVRAFESTLAVSHVS